MDDGLGDPRALLGTWHVERSIDDRRADEQHRLDGRLELEADDGRIAWRESLVWHRPDGVLDMGRRLWLVPGTDGWWVRFEDGRDFHPWRAGEPVVHPCAPDTYRGLVEGSPARWTVTWHATGPEKDYTMRSVLTPLSRRTPG